MHFNGPCKLQIRMKPGVKGLLLCHADAPQAPESPESQPVVTLTKLYDELKSGEFQDLHPTAAVLATLQLSKGRLPQALQMSTTGQVVKLSVWGAGNISFAVVRKLEKPLNAAERQRVRDFANRNVGKRMNARANILMADPSDSRLQRFNCLRAVFGRRFERCARDDPTKYS